MVLTPAAVVFDLGNVLTRWDFYPAIAAGVGDGEDRRFLDAADFDFWSWNNVQDSGGTWDDAEAAAAARAGMDAIAFTDTDHLQADLRTRGLPI